MSNVIFYFVSMVVALLLSFSSADTDPGTLSRINHVCFKNYDYYLCEEIFRKNLFTNHTDFVGLTQIAISQTLLYSSDTLKFLHQSQNNESNKTVRDLYQVCIEGYDVLLNQFEDAFFKHARGDYKSMLFDMSNCERFVNDCEKVLGGQNADVHKKNHVNKVLVQMSNVSGELIGQIVKK